MNEFGEPGTRVETAARLAAKAHAGQKRKADGSPYIVHPFMVAMVLARHGFPEAVVAAGLLHDVLEDTWTRGKTIEALLGPDVLELVRAVTQERIGDWHEKKRRYIDRLSRSPEGAKAVAAADKIHNLECLLRAHREQGPRVWRRFNKGREDKLGFEREVLAMLRRTWAHPILDEYERLLQRFEAATSQA
jgi:(p)ppGpp synthase/HD superfamily hydrolase